MAKFLLILGMLCVPSKVFAAAIGPVFPSTCTTLPTAGVSAWIFPSSATVEDGNNAINTNAASAPLYCSGYNFQIPLGGSITGVLFSVKKINVQNNNIDDTVKLYMNMVSTGNNKADLVSQWPASLSWTNYGGVSDLWGVSLTPAIVNDVLFGAAISSQKDGAGPSRNDVDAEAMTIFYTAPTEIFRGTIYSATLR